MCTDLTLLPFDCDHEDLSFSHNVLKIPRDSTVFDKIRATTQKEVPEGFTSYVSRDDAYEESHYGETIEDPYGDKVRYATAGDLKKCDIPGPAGAYVAELPDDNKVALFWH